MIATGSSTTDSVGLTVVVVVWLVLIYGLSEGTRIARFVKRRRLWRFVMAGLVGLGCTFTNGRKRR